MSLKKITVIINKITQNAPFSEALKIQRTAMGSPKTLEKGILLSPAQLACPGSPGHWIPANWGKEKHPQQLKISLKAQIYLLESTFHPGEFASQRSPSILAGFVAHLSTLILSSIPTLTIMVCWRGKGSCDEEKINHPSATQPWFSSVQTGAAAPQWLKTEQGRDPPKKVCISLLSAPSPFLTCTSKTHIPEPYDPPRHFAPFPQTDVWRGIRHLFWKTKVQQLLDKHWTDILTPQNTPGSRQCSVGSRTCPSRWCRRGKTWFCPGPPARWTDRCRGHCNPAETMEETQQLPGEACRSPVVPLQSSRWDSFFFICAVF